MGTLFIHPGWSKTGTSAIQKALDSAHNQLRGAGILYSKKLQQIDNAHHRFALAFKESGPYRSELNSSQAISLLSEEMDEQKCHSAIISSELSPNYFKSKEFDRFARRRFNRISLLFTVRRQSDLLLSLFSQLVTDPNVRYSASPFMLFMSNLEVLNFHSTILDWTTSSRAEEVVVIPYSKNIVHKVLEHFRVAIDCSFSSAANKTEQVNKSIKPKYLLLIQHACRNSIGAAQFRRQKDVALSTISSFGNQVQLPMLQLLSAAEQKAIDGFFKQSNEVVAKAFLNQDYLFDEKHYKSVVAIDPHAIKYLTTTNADS